MAGGVLLLALLLLFFEPLVALPLHGAAQWVSNFARAYLNRAHIERSVVVPFVWLLLPAGLAGLWVAQRVPPELARMAIGVFVLAATWIPAPGPRGGAPRGAVPRFAVAGALVGFANMLVGATGPILAPFLLSVGLARHAVVGTLAACQTLSHGVKLALFGAGGFSYASYALPLLGLAAAALAGTWLGTRLLTRLDERRFRVLVRAVLTALGFYLLLSG